MKTETLKEGWNEYRHAFISIGAVIILIIAVLLFLDLRQASITLLVPDRGSAVILDGKRTHVTSRTNQEITLTVAPGNHQILVAAKDRWPWTKEIVLSPSEDEYLVAFTLPETPQTISVGQNDAAYAQLNTLPAQPIHTATSSDKNVSLELEEGVLTATWHGPKSNRPSAFCIGQSCTSSIVVLESTRDIGDIGFLNAPGYVALFESAGNINAIELNAEGTQNFQPLYIGDEPRLITTKEGIYAYDRGSLLRIQY